ncbi:TRAP transporter small permease [Pararhodobacter aggregans]|uniref:TRAP transporter small permease n=1 Tax=Pararhodobacter aggregans TaxID=404875 RepID=UPI00235780D5|nr:TRAP transporter small permease [Pararhodobacter aggregans]
MSSAHILARFAGNDAWIARYHEVMIYLLVWAVLLSGALLVAEGRHIGVDLVVANCSEPVRRKLEIATTLISLIFSGTLVWYGGLITCEARDIGERSLIALRFPMWMYFAAQTTSCALMSVLFLFRLVALITGAGGPGSEGL